MDMRGALNIFNRAFPGAVMATWAGSGENDMDVESLTVSGQLVTGSNVDRMVRALLARGD